MRPEEFACVVARTQLRERARRMAYAILVEGVSAGVAAEREGVSRQAAHKAAQAVRRRALGGTDARLRRAKRKSPPFGGRGESYNRPKGTASDSKARRCVLQG